jgi:hypothetical protein
MTAPGRGNLWGCLADEARPMPDALPNEFLYREMLGWADFG